MEGRTVLLRSNAPRTEKHYHKIGDRPHRLELSLGDHANIWAFSLHTLGVGFGVLGGPVGVKRRKVLPGISPEELIRQVEPTLGCILFVNDPDDTSSLFRGELRVHFLVCSLSALSKAFQRDHLTDRNSSGVAPRRRLL